MNATKRFWISRSELLTSDEGPLPRLEEPSLRDFLDDIAEQMRLNSELRNSGLLFDRKTCTITFSGVVSATTESSAFEIAARVFRCAIEAAGGSDDTPNGGQRWRAHLLHETSRSGTETRIVELAAAA